MKKNARIFIILGILIIGVVLVLSFIATNSAPSITTSEFFDKMGVKYFYGEKGDADRETEINNYVVAQQDAAAIKGENFLVLIKGDNFIVTNQGEFDKIVIDAYNITGYKNNKKIASCSFSRSQEEWSVIEAIKSRQVGITVDNTDPNSGSVWSSVIMPLLMIALGLFVVILFMRQMGGGGGKSAFDFGKVNAQMISGLNVRFNDVAGAEEEKTELEEIVEFLKNPKKFSALGARIPKGVLLVGNPGTGKTLFAKAVAGEANVPFFSISGSDFVEMFVGVGASRVRDLFNTAKKNMPCIVFIDEIDAVGRQRGAGIGGGSDEREQTLNQLLVQMDGFESNQGIIIMAATNRADVLDPALLRPGRFDRQIYVNMPDVRGREAILKVHARNKPLASDVSFKILARMTAGFSGADLENLLNEAAILAARANRTAITNSDLYEGINKVLIGPQKKSKLVTETDKRITAYHESGHAVLARLLPNCDPVHEVSIIPRGMAEGYTMTRPDNDDDHLTRAKLLDDIVMTLGGRTAEELVIKDISAGASADIASITKRARKMVSEWGMSDLIGPISYGSEGEVFIGRDYQTRSDYSEDKAKLIDAEVERIIKEAHEKATKLLTENKSLLETMARVLVECETIYSEEVDMIMEGKSASEIIEHIEKNSNESGANPFTRTNGKMSEKSNSESSTDNKNGGNGLNGGNSTLNH